MKRLDFTKFPKYKKFAPTPGERFLVTTARRDAPNETAVALVECVKRDVRVSRGDKCRDCALNGAACPRRCAMRETVFRAIPVDPDALPDVDVGGKFRADADVRTGDRFGVAEAFEVALAERTLEPDDGAA